MVENFEFRKTQSRDPRFGSSKLYHIITFCITYRESFMCIT